MCCVAYGVVVLCDVGVLCVVYVLCVFGMCIVRWVCCVFRSCVWLVCDLCVAYV